LIDVHSGFWNFSTKLSTGPVGCCVDKSRGITWVAPEISFGHQFETRRFNLSAQHSLVDAMESFADRRIRVSLSGMVGDHQHTAGLALYVNRPTSSVLLGGLA
jgi:hypothetical protein